MPPDDATKILSVFISFIVRSLVVSLVGMVALKIAARWILKSEPGFGRCFLAVLIAHTVGGLLAFGVGFFAFLLGATKDLTVFVGIPIGIALQSAVIMAMFRVGFGKALLLALLTIAISAGAVYGLMVLLIAAGA